MKRCLFVKFRKNVEDFEALRSYDYETFKGQVFKAFEEYGELRLQNDGNGCCSMTKNHDYMFITYVQPAHAYEVLQEFTFFNPGYVIYPRMAAILALIGSEVKQITYAKQNKQSRGGRKKLTTDRQGSVSS